jgi:hypothetical protein
VAADRLGSCTLHQAGVVGGDGADEYSDGPSGEPCRDDVRLLQRLPGELKHEPLLGVKGGGLTGRDPEERRVEQIAVLEEGSEDTGAFRNGAAAVFQKPPEGFRIGRFRQSAGQSDDRYRNDFAHDGS